MANEEHLAILDKAVDVWNKWREENPDVLPDLSEADLRGVILSEADLGVADLSGALLNRAKLSYANLRSAILNFTDLSLVSFSSAKLVGADLTRADLTRADLSGADLTASNFTGAHLNGANLSNAILTGVNFNKSNMSETIFGNVDLRNVKGLKGINHWSRSVIGIETIFKSHGNIPEIFLRGAGVPDDMIGYIHSISGAIQFYSCFISYSTKDQEFAERLHADLQAKGVRCWFAPHDVQGGIKLHIQIDHAIKIHDKLLLILSKNSMNSEWVKTEIANARQLELKEDRQMLFPVSLVPFDEIKEWKAFDADTGKDSAREIREYYIPNFSTWKNNNSYQKAFDRLLRDLKANKPILEESE